MLKRINIYDIFIFLLLFFMAAGEIGGSMQPSRMLAIAFFPLAIYVAISRHEQFTTYRYEGIFLTFWLLWSILSLHVARNIGESIKDVVYLFVHSILFFEILIFSAAAKQPLHSLVAGWVSMILLTIPVALFEFIYDIHLPMSAQESGSMMNFGYTVMERRFASVTFGNLNSYNQVICYSLPFLLFGILRAKRRWESYICVAIWLILAYLVIRNSSRGALLCFGASGAVFSYYYYRHGKNKIAFMIVIVLAVIISSTYLASSFDFILERLSSQGGSDHGRTENILTGLRALADSYLFGIGTGNYFVVMGQEYGVAIPAPHNLFLETLVVYGIIVFIGFCLLFVHIFNIAHRGNSITRQFFILCMACLGTSFFIDSAYLNHIPTWAYLASLYIGSDARYAQISL